MNIRKIEKHILDTFVSLMGERVKVNRVVLFGSRARSDAEPDSDIDVLVVVEGLTNDVEDFISECAWQAGFEHGIVVAPVVFSRDDWENGPERYSLLSQVIREEGVPL